MKYDSERSEIHIDKELNELDAFTLDFVSVLERFTSYVIVSGYVSILLGRTRGSEDVDFLIPPLAYEQFERLFSELLSQGYECANTDDRHEAWSMLDEHAIRFFKKGMPVPNIEFKKITNEIQEYALAHRIKVILGEQALYLSPLELQIPYKLSLMSDADPREISSDKDFEDARHLYEIFKENLNRERLAYFAAYLKVEKKFNILTYGQD